MCLRPGSIAAPRLSFSHSRLIASAVAVFLVGPLFSARTALPVMKTPVVLSLIIVSVLSIRADESPASFLGRVPALPNQSCQVTAADRQPFLSQLAVVKRDLDRELDQRKKALVAWDRAQAASHPKLKKREADAIADQVLQERFNITREELNKSKKMSKEARRAWAKSVMTEMAATTQTNPEAAKAEQEKNNRLLEQMKAARFAAAKLQAEGVKFAAQLADLQKEFEEERDRNKKADREAFESDGSPPPKHLYCEKYTPRLRRILDDCRVWVVAAMPECIEFEKQQYQMAKMMVEEGNAAIPPGVTNAPKFEPPPAPAGDGGITGLNLVRELVDLLADVYRYDIDG